MHESDAELARRAQRGDKAAFAELFTRYERRIYGYLYRMVGDRAWAEDLAQETFIRAHQKLNRLSPPYDFKSWVYRIAGNLAIDGLRRYRTEVPLPDWDAGEATAPEPADDRSEADPEEEARRAEVRQAVWRTLHQLQENYRQVLLLREVEGLSYREIADVLGTSLDNVKVTLHRARLAFRDLYGLQVMVEEGRWVCSGLDELLSAEVDGELDRATRRRVKAHLKTCPVCQRTRKELLTVSSLLGLLAPVFPPPGLRSRFLTRLQHLPPPEPAAALPEGGRGGGAEGQPWVAWAGALGGIVLFLLAVALLVALVSHTDLAGVLAPSLPTTTPTEAPSVPGGPSPTAGSSPIPGVGPATGGPPGPTRTSSPEPSLTPTSRASPSPSPAPTQTATPSPTPTPTLTPTPGPHIAFWADATTIPAGSCTTVRWETADVQAVFFDGQGVPGIGSHQTCPCTAESHTLDVLLRDGSHDVRTLSIGVEGACATPTPDAQAPPAPTLLDPVGDAALTCTSTATLSWEPVSDPSGIAGYDVHLEEVVFTRAPRSWEWGPIGATHYDVPVSCGVRYRWTVRARDGAGNLGPWAAMETFSVGRD